ncbi:MAG: YggS family pyridoxal phosphate-dependent enzyme, partial [Lachnoanaerobaculum sp.]|nr:YggS family pyridoxal phosphate-dependent enzyme [Lachnoanaerobaculum sp.]
LMTIAPNVEKSEENRKNFKKIKKISVDIIEKNYDNIEVEFLSMGMSGDYTVALEEGANLVRVGTGIFGKR